MAETRTRKSKTKPKASAEETTVEISLWERMELISGALSSGGAGSADILTTEFLRRRLVPTDEEVETFALAEVSPGAWQWFSDRTPELHACKKTFGFTDKEIKRIKRGFRIQALREPRTDPPSLELLLKFVPIEDIEAWGQEEEKQRERANRDRA